MSVQIVSCATERDRHAKGRGMWKKYCTRHTLKDMGGWEIWEGEGRERGGEGEE